MVLYSKKKKKKGVFNDPFGIYAGFTLMSRLASINSFHLETKKKENVVPE